MKTEKSKNTDKKTDVDIDEKYDENGSSPSGSSEGSETKTTGRAKGKKKDKELEKLRKEVEFWKDKAQRTAAEFDNYRKRKEKETAESWKLATEDIVKKLLPVIDDFERSLDAANTNDNYEALKQGVELIYQSLKRLLEAEGVHEMDAQGQEFNPEYHEALMQMEKEGTPENIVLDVHQKGYILGEKIIRPAKVVVSK